MIIGVSGKAQSGKDTVCKMIAYTIWYYKYSQRLKPFGVDGYNNCTDKNQYYVLLNSIDWHQTSFARKLKKECKRKGRNPADADRRNPELLFQCHLGHDG